jgi:hypothetical protein
MTDEEKALMRKRFMKCYVELLLLPDEVLREEFPDLFKAPNISPPSPPSVACIPGSPRSDSSSPGPVP